MGVFIHPVADEPFLLFLNIGLPLVLESTTVATGGLLCPSLFTIARTAALPYCSPISSFYFIISYIQKMIQEQLVFVWWVERVLRRPWGVSGPFRTWESFFVLWVMIFFVCI